MESVKVNNCPVCNSELTSDLIHLDLKDPFHVVEDKFRYEQCKGCDSWILNPRPRLEDMGKFYEQDFLFDLDEKEAPKKGLITKIADAIQVFNMVSEVNMAAKHLGETSKHLDYSAGNGQILSLIQKKKPNCKYFATEFSETYRNYLISNPKIMEVHKDLSDFEEDKKFDLISLYGVLEHVQAPRELIVELRDRLEANGKLIIAVPNVCAFQRYIFGKKWYSWLAPRHWQMFTINNLKKLMEEFNFEIIDEKHFFLRTCSATLVTSLFPSLDPLKKGGGIKFVLYGILFYTFIPFELFAGLLKRSGFMGVVAKKIE